LRRLAQSPQFESLTPALAHRQRRMRLKEPTPRKAETDLVSMFNRVL
jgi:hypothetical protein